MAIQTDITERPSRKLNEFDTLSNTLSTEANLNMERTPVNKTPSEEPSIDEWVKSIILPDPEENPTVHLSRFGFKNAQDIITFIKSPAGDTVKAQITEKMALEDAIREEQRIVIQDHNLLMHRVRALLFLWLIEKETHAADKVKESIARQIEKILHDGEKHQSTTRPTTIKKNEVNDVLANYDMAIKKVEEHLTDNIAKGKFLSEQIIGLEQQGIHIASKYEASEASLAQVKHPTEIHGDLSHEEIANHIHDAINQYNTKIQQHTDKITVTNPSNDVTQLMQQLINLNLNLLCYREMLLVHQGQYQYFNAKGEPASFRDAHFLLEKGDNQKIVEHEGVIYLLKPEQDLNSIKESPEAQQQAKQHYEQSKHVVMTVMRGFHHQKSIETAENKNQLEIAKTQLTQNQQEHVLMENQRNLLQSARAGVQNLHNSGQEAPRPTPTAGNASLTKPSQASATQFYREQIQSIQASERTPECLFNLISKAPGDRKAASSYLEIALANLPRNKPIPTIIMQSLLKNMERFGVDATKSSVTSIENPLEASHKTPSPLRTIPDPYKV